MFDMWATANFAGSWIIKIANGVDFEFVWIFFPELAVGLQSVFGVVFIVFIKGDFKIRFNPFMAAIEMTIMR